MTQSVFALFSSAHLLYLSSSGTNATWRRVEAVLPAALAVDSQRLLLDLFHRATNVTSACSLVRSLLMLLSRARAETSTGHWIQECPTLDDPNIDPKQRFKRMAGVPRSQLEVVGEDAAADGKDIMVLQDGTRVRQIADKSAWERQAIRLPTTADDVHKSQPTDPDLTCPICSKLLKEAVVVPCCSTAFCDECIRSYLVKHANACYECETRLKSVAVLKVDEDRRRRVAEYVQEMVRVGKEAAKVEGAEAGSRASSAVPGGEVKDELSEVRSLVCSPLPFDQTIAQTASNGPTIDPNRSIGARPPPKPLTILQQSQLAQAENLVKIMLLLASPNLTPQHRTQLQGQLASMQHLVSGVKGVYRPGVAPPNLLPARMPGVPPHSMMPHQPPGVPTGPRGNAFGLGAGRGRGGFGIPQQQWGYHQQQPFQQQQQNGFGYNNGVRDLSAFREGSGIKRERPPDFVTLGGPSEKMYRAE